MSRKQSKDKNDKKRTANQQNNPNKLEDYLSQIEKKSTEMQVSLSSSQIQHLNVEHQLLISSAYMSQILKSFDKQISPHFQETQSPQMIKLYHTWREWMESSIIKYNSQRRQLVQRLVVSDDKEKRKNPVDEYEKRKSHILSKEIRQREQLFKIKTNFAGYSKNHFQRQTQEIKDLVDFKAKRVSETTIKEMFKKEQEQKLNQIAHNFEQQEKQEQKRLLQLMREASKLKNLEAQKKRFLITEKHRNQLNVRKAACKELGNSIPLLINLHDAMAFPKN